MDHEPNLLVSFAIFRPLHPIPSSCEKFCAEFWTNSSRGPARLRVEKEGRIFLFFSKFVLFLAQQNKGEIAESGDDTTCSSVVFVSHSEPQRVKRLLERIFWFLTFENLSRKPRMSFF
jgi:hypothetical protein